MVVVVVVVTVVLSAALLALVREAAQLKKAIARLEQRIGTLERDSAPTVVIEPDAEPTQPRPRNVLVN
ncbi:MAG TPA: hypothetical protein VF997_01665 [Polyangia bacterium]